MTSHHDTIYSDYSDYEEFEQRYYQSRFIINIALGSFMMSVILLVFTVINWDNYDIDTIKDLFIITGVIALPCALWSCYWLTCRCCQKVIIKMIF